MTSCRTFLHLITIGPQKCENTGNTPSSLSRYSLLQSWQTQLNTKIITSTEKLVTQIKEVNIQIQSLGYTIRRLIDLRTRSHDKKLQVTVRSISIWYELLQNVWSAGAAYISLASTVACNVLYCGRPRALNTRI